MVKSIDATLAPVVTGMLSLSPGRAGRAVHNGCRCRCIHVSEHRRRCQAQPRAAVIAGVYLLCRWVYSTAGTSPTNPNNVRHWLRVSSFPFLFVSFPICGVTTGAVSRVADGDGWWKFRDP